MFHPLFTGAKTALILSLIIKIHRKTAFELPLSAFELKMIIQMVLEPKCKNFSNMSATKPYQASTAQLHVFVSWYSWPGFWIFWSALWGSVAQLGICSFSVYINLTASRSIFTCASFEILSYFQVKCTPHFTVNGLMHLFLISWHRREQCPLRKKNILQKLLCAHLKCGGFCSALFLS
jgi:hypothetical protein